MVIIPPGSSKLWQNTKAAKKPTWQEGLNKDALVVLDDEQRCSSPLACFVSAKVCMGHVEI